MRRLSRRGTGIRLRTDRARRFFVADRKHQDGGREAAGRSGQRIS
ncbi:unnamed protein product [Ixodes pacificus]